MEVKPVDAPKFPKDLVDWIGHHSGGVKRLFDERSGRPSKKLLRTNLLSKLELWVKHVAAGVPNTPRLLLLVGGPGNGKTEAIESTIRWLDEGLACEGALIKSLSKAFHPEPGLPVPRVVQINAGDLAAIVRPLELNIVQDATATAGFEGDTAPGLLIAELQQLMNGSDSQFYLCCVNRGVLDDALIRALDNELQEPLLVLEAITRSVSLSAKAPSCWPLEGFPSVAIWPMDAESLLVRPSAEDPPPALTLLEYAVESAYWPAPETCPAGAGCPFCHSQSLLSREDHRSALIKILRWYELASGKRWNFRDLFSLISYLLAGYRASGQGSRATPCDWAAHLIEVDKSTKISRKPRKQDLAAIFHLATSSYQHALFHKWEKGAANALRQEIRDLGLESDVESEEGRTLLGFQYFLYERKSPYLPATIATLLEGLVDLLDPAMASPDSEVDVSTRSKINLGEMDIRFSRSISSGIEFIRKYQVLSTMELDLLKRLSKVDLNLSSPSVRRKKPTAASKIQRMLRDFACRLARRSICTRSAVMADAAILQSFQHVVEDDTAGQRLYEVAKQVRNLLNNRQDFEVSLTTTFGQPLPPSQRQATLVVPVRQVRTLAANVNGRPRSPICFLEVGAGISAQPIALTYELFKAVKELDRGLSPSSLPRAVVALLDTTKARLSGPIVRDPDVLMDAKIRVGSDGTVIAQSWNAFVSLNEEVQP